MALHTFKIWWKDTDGKTKCTRLFTRNEESAEEYMLNNHTDTFVEIVSCKQERDRTIHCTSCGHKLSSNFI